MEGHGYTDGILALLPQKLMMAFVDSLKKLKIQ